MPASEAREDQRRARIFTILFWVGVAFAPIAALMLLIGSGTGSLRAAVGVLILSVVLIGVSIALRREGETIRSDIEETLFSEIDAVRADVRDDIGHAAQATHRAFGERMQYLVDQLEAARAELEANRLQLETLRHQAMIGQQRQVAVSAPGQRPGVPGMVRHTETVQVTTRHTVMDGHEEETARGNGYGSRPVSGARGSHSRDRENSWDDPRDRHDRRREVVEPAADRWREPAAVVERWSGEDNDREGFRAGDRWASVHSDERGRELRMGERRAAVRSDGYGGTEVRIEDRWAAVRREAGLDGPSGQRGWGDDRGWGDEQPRERRAITGSSREREERWSDYRDEREREREREWERYR